MGTGGDGGNSLLKGLSGLRGALRGGDGSSPYD